MGSQILKISPLAASRTFTVNVSAPALARLNPNPINRTPKPPIGRIIRYSSSYLAGGFCGLSLNQGKKGFRSGVVAMAATDSVQKSDEEWRAILSPEQFRILMQKGTDLCFKSSTEEFVEQCINDLECLTIGVRKQNKAVGGYLISTRWHKNFWLLA